MGDPLSCPICKRPVAAKATNTWFPFCSDRCKIIDLGKWLSGDYRVPVQSDEDGEAPLPEESDPDSRLH